MFKKKIKKNVNTNVDGISNIDAPLEDKKKNPYLLFLSFVVNKMKEDKLYFLSFIITLIFVILFSIYNIYEAEGLYKHKDDKPIKNETVVYQSNEDVLDIKDYIGIYSKEIILDNALVINDSCTIDAYKIAYQIKKDKSIAKYFVSDCVGTVEIWKDKLNYVTTGGARYISANNLNYLFASSSMKEVDGDTFTIDDDLTSLKNNIKLKNSNVYFEGKGIILMTNNNLYLLNGEMGTNVLADYQSNGGNLDKLVYKSDIKRQFNFIVFYNEENVNCYTSVDGVEVVDGSLYKIYSIKYNIDSNTFNKPKEIISRNKSAGCDVLEEDLALLTE